MIEESEKKDGGYDEPWNRICRRTKKKKDTKENKKTKKEKKDGFERNGVLEKKKMGVMTNHGIEFTKKKMGLRESVY